MKTKTNHSLKNHHEGFIRVPEKKNRKKKNKKVLVLLYVALKKKTHIKHLFFSIFVQFLFSAKTLMD